ncbi:transposase [Streptomyces sp. NPDC059340]|uniref:transposase n=1 Tax=Streptomyces sp. NPDC059340 TaxID=3346806 RepID=UPI0036A9580E
MRVSPKCQYSSCPAHGRGGDRRLVLDAIFYLVRSGITWRALPSDFPPHQTVYALFRRWTCGRAWCRICGALRDRAHLADPRPDKDVTVRQMHPRTVGPGKKAPILSR